jgi:hypothetical protein
MWSDIGESSEPEPARCRNCGRRPMLRLKPARGLPYVEFECAQCPRFGGLAVTENEAMKLWNEKNL